MCIISGPVISVNSTKILCIPSKDGKRQLIVYKNAVATPDSNAMCLPCPNPQTVEFEHVAKDIFSQCDSSFERVYPRSSGGPTLSAGGMWGTRSKLEVKSHGSYDVVLVPSMDDLDRVPEDFTTLTSEVVQFLKSSYQSGFGVVLCRLKRGSTDYEPFAYSHQMQSSGELFFPTKHFHMETHTNQIGGLVSRDNYASADEYGHRASNSEPEWAQSFRENMISKTEVQPKREAGWGFPLANTVNAGHLADDWDHELYSAGTPKWCHESRYKRPMGTNSIDWSKMPSDFRLGSGVELRCKEVVGRSPNIDIQMAVPFVKEVA
jgi:hypothetical protein